MDAKKKPGQFRPLIFPSLLLFFLMFGVLELEILAGVSLYWIFYWIIKE